MMPRGRKTAVQPVAAAAERRGGGRAGSPSKGSTKLADITIGMPTGMARTVAGAVGAYSGGLQRARAVVTVVPAGVRLRIEADDTGALRAAVNSYLRWIAVASDVGTCVAERKPAKHFTFK